MWAEIEAQLGRFLVTIMGSNAPATLAMFHAVQNSQAKIDMILAAAPAVLPPKKLEWWDAIAPLAIAAAKQRHQFAHHIWGLCHELPEALLLVDPRDRLSHTVEEHKLLNTLSKNPTSDELKEYEAKLPKFPLEKVMVYLKKDFESYIETTRQTLILLDYLCLAVHPAYEDGTLDALLLGEPAFQRALSKLHLQRSSPEAQPS